MQCKSMWNLRSVIHGPFLAWLVYEFRLRIIFQIFQNIPEFLGTFWNILEKFQILKFSMNF